MTQTAHPFPAAQPSRLRGVLLGLASVAALAACEPLPPAMPPAPPSGPVVSVPQPGPAAARPRDAARMAASNFISVIDRMEPLIERECVQRRRAPINCDFQFVVDDRAGLEPNAFQTLDSQGRPVIGFTLSLLAAAHNTDELAFVVGHEASHHILNHISQKSTAAVAGAVILSGIAAAAGGDVGAIRSAQEVGANVGARYYSKEWELQADYLGAVITRIAGYDPVNGARFFDRMPDPGNRVLGSHPSREQRKATVARAVADVRSGQAN